MEIKILKQYFKVNDSKEELEYWKSEGNNSLMQSYCNISKFLQRIIEILNFLFTILILVLSTSSLITLFEESNNIVFFKMFNDNNNYSLVNAIKNIYIVSIGIIMIVNFGLLTKKIITKKEMLSRVKKGILILPIIILMIFSFSNNGTFLITLISLIVIALLNLLISNHQKTVQVLYKSAVGKNKGKGE